MAQKRSADIYIQRDIAGTFHSNSPLTLHSSPIMTSSRMRKPYRSYDNSKNHNLTLQSKAMKNGENTHCAFHTCLFPTLWGRQISYFVSKFVAFYHPPRSTNLPHSSKSCTHTHTHIHTRTRTALHGATQAVLIKQARSPNFFMETDFLLAFNDPPRSTNYKLHTPSTLLYTLQTT